MTQQTLEYIQHLIHQDLQQAGAMVNNAHNHEPNTRTCWRAREEIALNAMRQLADMAAR